MKRRDFLKTTAAFAGGVLFSNKVFDFKIGSTRKPNIILIFIDDMGWQDVGFMGSTYYETPNIDQLAADGMIFTDAYANAANCAPTRACLNSGKYSPRHGIYTVGTSERGQSKDRKIIPTENTTILDPSFVTIAESLKAGGYTTASMGKWHLGADSRTPPTGPEAQGFDLNIGGDTSGGPGDYWSPFNRPNMPTDPNKPNEYITDRINDEAVAFIEANKDTPFYLYLTHYAVHSPIQAKEELIAHYENKPPSDGQGDLSTSATYAAMIESVDQGVEMIVNKLEELNLTNDTVIVFTADNGGYCWATTMPGLRGSKGMFYEGGIREPFCVKWPGVVQPGTTCDVPIISLDLYPTFLEMAGIEKPQDLILDGESLVPLMKQTGSLSRQAIFWHFPAYLQAYGCEGGSNPNPKFRAEPLSVIRKGEWKLIENFQPDPEPFIYELYNLATDILETNNLADINTAKRDELIADLHAWQQATNAPIPTNPNPDYVP